MVAHERYITVTEAGKVTVSGLPVKPGQQLRVTVALDQVGRQRITEQLRSVFRQLQSLPQVKSLSEEDIAREIDAHRRDRGAA